MPTVKSRKEVSSTESCAFVVHSLCLPLAILYVLWAWVSDDTLHSLEITYHPPKAFALYLPTVLYFAFMVTPLLYFILNASSAPNSDSLDTIWDGHSREKQPFTSRKGSLQEGLGSHKREAEVPEIYDMDVFEVNKLFLK